MKKGLNRLKKSELILPIIASIGVGAAAYYTMSKNNSSISKTVENMAPLLSNLSNSSNSNQNENTEKLGPHGMS